MKKNKQCSVIRDLLPNYIENLTSEDTNNFIESHIENCEECEQILKDMKGDIKLKKINSKKEINALKKIKNKFRIKSIIFLCIFSLTIVACTFFWNNYSLKVDDNGKLYIKKHTLDKSMINNNQIIMVKSKEKLNNETKDGYIYYTTIITIDDNMKCSGVREKEEGYTDEGIKARYYILEKGESSGIQTNPKMINNYLYYNNNIANGKDKEEAINTILAYREIIEIEEY
ncbi:MAG: zf-HC2 domain-containing protein [Clostridia bacterium]|nr:zf-HC2 domain-containing protein [Clostridia bacterium]